MREKEYREPPYDEENGFELFDEEYPVSSSTECTGLIPTAVHDETTLRSYGQIYDIPLSKDEQAFIKDKKQKRNSSDNSSTSL